MATATAEFDPVQSQVDQIRAINRHLYAAVNQVDAGVVIVSAETIPGEEAPPVVFANHSASRLTGLPMEELLELPVTSLFDASKIPNFCERLPATAVTGKTYSMDLDTIGPGGAFRKCNWTIRCLRDRERHPENYIFTFVEPPAIPEPLPSSETGSSDSPEPDVGRPSHGGDESVTESRANGSAFDPKSGSDQEGSEQGPGLSLEQEEQIETSKLETLALVASGIAHDFRNYLTTILANLSLVRMEVDPDCVSRKFLDAAHGASQNAEALTQQLLRYARGRGPERELVDIGEILTEAKRLASYGSNTLCEVSIADDLAMASVSRTQITQVINNLLINARQAMPNGGVILASAENVAIEQGSSLDLKPGDYILVRVRDRGCGIKPEDLENIFKPFFTKKKNGSGLGLATCYSIVVQHSGLITVRSKVDVGTEFKVYLPVAKDSSGDIYKRGSSAPEEEASSSESEEQHRESVSKPRSDAEFEVVHGEGSVLVVDDQEELRSVASAILQKVGYEVVEADTGERGLQCYQNSMLNGREFSAVLMDMTLPGGMSGEEATREILNLSPNAKVIATSGFFEDKAEEAYAGMGFTGILPKPYNAVSLSHAIAEMVGD